MNGALSSWAAGLRASVSLMVGYAPIAFSFGVIGVQSGFSPCQTLAISAGIFAGASQFLMVAMLAAGSGTLAVLSTVLLMNLRHVFYGPALMARLQKPPRRLRPWLAFGLTDEVFATAMAHAARQPLDGAWCLGLATGAYAAWVAGTGLGAGFGGQWQTGDGVISRAMAFVLPALFLALSMQAYQRRDWPIVLSALVTTVIGLAWLPAHWALLLGMLSGALAGTMMPRSNREAA
ncbi:AzlC family ABC transporter permease [Halomonas shantousis]